MKEVLILVIFIGVGLLLGCILDRIFPFPEEDEEERRESCESEE